MMDQKGDTMRITRGRGHSGDDHRARRRPVRRVWVVVRHVAALALAFVLVACGTTTPSDDPTSGVPAGIDELSAPLLLTNGLTPIGPTQARAVVVGDMADAPWLQYLEVSKAIGLDFGALEGRPAQLRMTPIRGREPDAAAYVLVVDGRAVGAWIGPGGTTSGVLPLNAGP
jgi:hypothetical protein